jgi:hypothetical protein
MSQISKARQCTQQHPNPIPLKIIQKHGIVKKRVERVCDSTRTFISFDK